jgi:predicted small metal-binding protein
MSPDDTHTQDPCDIAPVLTDLLHTVETNNCDPTGTYTLPARAAEQPAYTVEITVAATPADRRSQPDKHSYCLDCEWTASTTEHPHAEVTTRMVRHATETGHDIESTTTPDVLGDGTDRSPSL